MKLVIQKTQEEFDAEVIQVEDSEFSVIKKYGQFKFDWTKEKQYQVFKIVSTIEDNEEIYGLISLMDVPKEMRIHISLIENSNDNKGKSKRIDRVAGCLLAFAVKRSFEKGYLGFVSLVPKTELIELYVDKYGFSRYGMQLAIEREAAVQLIQKYL